MTNLPDVEVGDPHVVAHNDERHHANELMALVSDNALIPVWLVVSETAPAESVIDGKPVVWIDLTSELTPVPVNPTPPEWDDTESKFAISDLVGINYLLNDIILDPGFLFDTTGAFPRHVDVVAQAKPGYVILTDATFSHDFPDPDADLLLTSDGFSGANGTELVGRAADLALGGTAKSWTGTTNAWEINTNRARIKASGTAYNSAQLVTTAHNLRVEFDLVSLTTANANGVSAYIIIERTNGLQILVELGDDRSRFQSVDNVGGNPDLQMGIGVAPVLGAWSIQLYQRTVTIIPGTGQAPQVFDLSDEVAYKSEVGNEVAKLSLLRDAGAADTFVIDNLKLTRVGF